MIQGPMCRHILLNKAKVVCQYSFINGLFHFLTISYEMLKANPEDLMVPHVDTLPSTGIVEGIFIVL